MAPNFLIVFESFAYVIVALAVMFFARAASNLLFQGKRPDNMAFALRRGGMYLGIMYAMTAAFEERSRSTFQGTLTELFLDGLIIVLCLLVVQKVNDILIVPRVDNDEAVREGNVAVGLTEFGSYISASMIAYSAFAGATEGNLWAIALTFFFLGQLALVASFWLQEALLPGSFVDEVRKGNLAAGLMVAGTLVSLGLILQSSIAGDFTGWQSSLSSFGAFAATGTLALLVMQWVFLKFFMRGSLVVAVQGMHSLPITVVAVCGQLGIALMLSHLAS